MNFPARTLRKTLLSLALLFATATAQAREGYFFGKGGDGLELNPDFALTPASTMKLVTAFWSIHVMGTGYRIPTQEQLGSGAFGTLSANSLRTLAKYLPQMETSYGGRYPDASINVGTRAGKRGQRIPVYRYELAGQPVTTLLRPLFENSSNPAAGALGILAKSIFRGAGEDDFEDALREMARWFRLEVYRECHIELGDLGFARSDSSGDAAFGSFSGLDGIGTSLGDGGGLEYELSLRRSAVSNNRISPRAMTCFLRGMMRQPYFNAIYSQMVQLGRGTLGSRLKVVPESFRMKVHAKTGHLERSRKASCLAGFIEAPTGLVPFTHYIEGAYKDPYSSQEINFPGKRDQRIDTVVNDVMSRIWQYQRSLLMLLPQPLVEIPLPNADHDGIGLGRELPPGMVDDENTESYQDLIRDFGEAGVE
jgi:hypothetical protein